MTAAESKNLPEVMLSADPCASLSSVVLHVPGRQVRRVPLSGDALLYCCVNCGRRLFGAAHVLGHVERAQGDVSAVRGVVVLSERGRIAPSCLSSPCGGCKECWGALASPSNPAETLRRVPSVVLSAKQAWACGRNSIQRVACLMPEGLGRVKVLLRGRRIPCVCDQNVSSTCTFITVKICSLRSRHESPFRVSESQRQLRRAIIQRTVKITDLLVGLKFTRHHKFLQGLTCWFAGRTANTSEAMSSLGKRDANSELSPNDVHGDVRGDPEETVRA
jgi:hypothetical protein